ncbi:MAG: hypothetical protein GYA51_15205 [Candidatus Methanofastidiosa archaeon]|nr:hypothetical protein [Candidatus Methanofastidiosa archaeon]
MNMIEAVFHFLQLTAIFAILYTPGFIFFLIFLRFLKTGKGIVNSEEYNSEEIREKSEGAALWGCFLMLLVLFVSLVLFVNDNKRLLWICIHLVLIILFIIFLKLYMKEETEKKKEEKRRKFIVGEKYLVHHKRIGELKEEIKEWLSDNKMTIIREEEDRIKAGRSKFGFFYPNISINIKFIQKVSSTVIVFDKNLTKRYSIANLGFKKVQIELRKNLIRKLSNQEEIKIDLTRFFIVDYIFLFCIFFFLLYLFWNKFVEMPTLSFIWGFTVISFLLARRLWLSHKIKRISNSCCCTEINADF